MATSYFIWLGSRRSRRHPLAAKAALLDIAASRGLPVPAGAVLLDSLFQLLRQEGVLHLDKDGVGVSRPEWLSQVLFADVRLPRFDRAVAVRTGRIATPVAARRHARARSVVLDVNSHHAADLAAALCAAWSVGVAAGWPRQDLLIQEMVAPLHHGVAHLDAGADRVTLAGSAGNGAAPLKLPRLPAWRRPDAALPDFARRLQQLLRGIRRSFGEDVRQVTWMDDGQICWLVQLATTPGA